MTTTIKIAFTYENEKYNLTAIMTPDLELIKPVKRNQAGTLTDYTDDNFWSLAFYTEDTGRKYMVELEFKEDELTHNHTNELKKVLLWDDDVIIAEIDQFSYAYSAVTK